MTSSAVNHYEALLGKRNTSPAEMRNAIYTMDDNDLSSYGLSAYRMNLISLFGSSWSPQRINDAARAAALGKLWFGWEYYQEFLKKLGPGLIKPHLEGDLIERIRDLLAVGRGVLVVSFHQGHMRHIPSDIANAGIDMYIPLASDSWRNYQSAYRANPTAAMWNHFHYVDVEMPRGALTLARVMSRNGCVFSTIDGNTGMDGPRGEERRTLVKMHERRARVKDGLLTMAAKFGTPVLPVIAHTDEGRRVCQFAPVLDPGARLQGEAATKFVAEAAQTLYSMLADDLTTHADEWCGGDLFHQWRVAEPHGAAGLVEVEDAIRRVIHGRAKVIVNHVRATSLGNTDGMTIVDALSMRGYKVPPNARALFDDGTIASSRSVEPAGAGNSNVSAQDVAWLKGMLGRELLTVSDCML